MKPTVKYVFHYGPSPSYRWSVEVRFTFAEARAAAYEKRVAGYSTSRVKKVAA